LYTIHGAVVDRETILAKKERICLYNFISGLWNFSKVKQVQVRDMLGDQIGEENGRISSQRVLDVGGAGSFLLNDWEV
jgi:hypothetical protein